MIKVLIGRKGTGKTKTLIESINNAVSVSVGDIVFVSNNMQRHMYDIHHQVRLVDTSEFNINNYNEFYGFLCGIISGNFDVSNIFIDSIFKIVGGTYEGLENFFDLIENLSKKFSISFYFTISLDTDEIPEHLKKYL